ncbi:3-oxoacyl-ACP synthase [Haliangium ochraceum]|uniref:3-Oxoacyl-(Acyl-carrier-protein (ACP)) synthase III domain protein n=1 Tax=Haliangium ochraceum (strain DSM 14365 / JCM 11303 / SMP-2) TaxID=502025 RepID=D0LRX3_HALO1|nr:3-oxoacyl-ACP synthase [Haliangium ochraceum]ACY13670.1 3-Oxoacyl-(acyl-carrier-protein (ACP)) synthase III domain protein [Haliangium ochraceum DSM 14365]
MVELRLDAFASCIGAPRPLAELDGVSEEVRALLLGSGLSSVPHAEESPPHMAREALRRSLEAAGLEAASVGTVVWSSTSFHQRSWYTSDVSHVLAELGLTRANAVGVTLGECGNLGPALRVAEGLVAGGAAPLLLVCTDAVRPDVDRVVPPSATVLGDGAVACVVSPTRGRVSVRAVSQISNHLLRRIDPQTQAVRTLRVTAQGVARAAKAALDQAGLEPARVSRLLLTNQNKAVRLMFAQQCGIPVERIRTPTIADNAHLFAADILAGLPSVSAELDIGDHILAVANGTCTWTGIVFRIEESV